MVCHSAYMAPLRESFAKRTLGFVKEFGSAPGLASSAKFGGMAFLDTATWALGGLAEKSS